MPRTRGQVFLTSESREVWRGGGIFSIANGLLFSPKAFRSPFLGPSGTPDGGVGGVRPEPVQIKILHGIRSQHPSDCQNKAEGPYAGTI